MSKALKINLAALLFCGKPIMISTVTKLQQSLEIVMLIEKVSRYMEKFHMISEDDVIAAGVSGGADSVCLLLVLSAIKKTIPFRLLVVHVNHLIRIDAAKDALFVKTLCEEQNIPFFLVEEDVKAIAKARHVSTEEAGRQIRYEAFRQILQKEAPDAYRCKRAKIAVAHNMNDRAETMLFHLFRGSGLTGLASIRPIRDKGQEPKVIRPLLGVTRIEIEDFLTKSHVAWCTDYTNEEDGYTRNRIRHHILPFAEKEIAAGAVANMGRAADILSEAEDFIQGETKKAYEDCIISTNALTEIILAEKLLQYPPFLQKQVILYCLEKITPARKDITSTHIEEIRTLFTNRKNRELHLPCRVTARREYEKVVLERKAVENTAAETKSFSVKLPGPGEEPVRIFLSETKYMEFRVDYYENSMNIPENQYTKWLDYDKIKKSLTIRTRQSGDYFFFNQAFHKKSVQNYMVENKIPKTQRDRIWLLAEEKHILWIVGHRISSYYKINENTKCILQVQLKGG